MGSQLIWRLVLTSHEVPVMVGPGLAVVDIDGRKLLYRSADKENPARIRPAALITATTLTIQILVARRPLPLRESPFGFCHSLAADFQLTSAASALRNYYACHQSTLREHTKLKKHQGCAISFASLALYVSLSAQAVNAQSPATPLPQSASDADEGGRRVFEAAYFRPYNPVTAFDMVSRVPGFEILDGVDRRGYGATAGNVLVNNERPSSKSLTSDQLKRIPADGVARIELVSGANSDVDVRGQTQLVNVVLKEQRGQERPTTWSIETWTTQWPMLSWDGRTFVYLAQATKAFELDDATTLSIDLQTPGLPGRAEYFEAVKNPAGELLEYRLQRSQSHNRSIQGVANLEWRPSAADTFNLNVLYRPSLNINDSSSFVFDATNAFRSATIGGVKYGDIYKAEVASDWEHKLSPVLSFKLVGLLTASSTEQADTFQTVRAVGGLVNTQYLDRATDTGERVGRASLTWRPNDFHTLEAGFEGAFNFRDANLALTNNTGSGPVPAVLPVADTRVEELRGEASLTDVWKLTPALTLETGFTFEASRITQTGDAQQEREFTYPKPRAILTWQLDPSNQLRASYIRDVAQLDFAEFASNVAVIDNLTTFGNPNLEPEKTWKAKLEWERRFTAKMALAVSFFYDDVSDTQDLIPLSFCAGPGSVQDSSCASADIRTLDGAGNIGNGTRTGVEARFGSPLDFLGIPNAELRFTGKFQKTSATDPVTGESREFTLEPAWNYLASFRQELPELSSAWGASIKKESQRSEYKLAEEVYFNRDADRLDVYFETTAVQGLMLRFSVISVGPTPEERVRTFYAGSRASGVVVRTEARKAYGAAEGTRIISLKASGAF